MRSQDQNIFNPVLSRITTPSPQYACVICLEALFTVFPSLQVKKRYLLLKKTQMANEANQDDRLKKLFVGGLKRDTSDDTLKEYFGSYGEMTDCVVIRDNLKQSRGFGYVTYADKESVIQVLIDKKEKPHSIDGKEVEVKRAIPRDDSSPTSHLKTKKIFIGGLADEATAEDVKNTLAEQVRQNFPTSVDLIMRKNEDGSTSTKHRGFCFVEFEDEDLVDELCCIKKVTIAGKAVEIKKAEPKDKAEKGGGRGGGRGGRGGMGGRGGRGGGGGGGNQYGGYQSSTYDQYYSGGGSYGGYGQGDGYGYDSYGYGTMGAYAQAPTSYGPQQGYGGRGGRYRPY